MAEKGKAALGMAYDGMTMRVILYLFLDDENDDDRESLSWLPL
jgi:hypothetical protein